MDQREAASSSRAAHMADAGLGISQDQVARLERAGLLPLWETARKNHREGIADYLARATAIDVVVSRIKSKRPRASEIGFWLAYDGLDAPVDRVLEHLEHTIQKTIALLRRYLDRLGPGHLTHSPSVGRLAGLLSKAVVKLVFRGAGRLGVVETAVALCIALLLRALLRRTTFEVVEWPLRSFVSWLTGNRDPDPGSMRSLWDILSEAMQLVRLDTSNPMLRALRDVAEGEPNIAIVYVQATRKMLEAAGRVFPWMKDAEALADRFGDAVDYDLVNRYMPPAICAMLLLERNRPVAQENIRRLLSGDSSQVVNDLSLLKTIADFMSAAFQGLAEPKK